MFTTLHVQTVVEIKARAGRRILSGSNEGTSVRVHACVRAREFAVSVPVCSGYLYTHRSSNNTRLLPLSWIRR